MDLLMAILTIIVGSIIIFLSALIAWVKFGNKKETETTIIGREYSRMKRNKYIENIYSLMKKQESKGLSTYGQLLQDNTSMTTVDRIEYLEEELVDALMYLEHLKESVKNLEV